MAIVEIDQNTLLPERSNYDMEIERDPTFRELFQATTENENLIWNVANRFARPHADPDPDYDYAV